MKTVKERLVALRQAMKNKGVSAYIIPGTDPHASEYIAEHWKEREWISGFTGSAGTAVVLLEDAGLWTDSRYFLQADIQLAESGIRLFKDGLPETPTINQWIISCLSKGEKVAINPEMFSVNGYNTALTEFENADLGLVPCDLIAEVWSENRPNLPLETFYAFEEKYAGKSVSEKLAEVRSMMTKHKSDVYVLSSLDDIAWLFNIRGADVDFNPVVIAYATITLHTATLFVASEKITPELSAYFIQNNISVSEYTTVLNALQCISESETVLFDASKMNRALYDSLPVACKKVSVTSVIAWLKSMKNEIEIAGVKKAMLIDGVSLVRFFMWLENAVKTQTITECDTMRKLTEFRAAGENFKGESFSTIAGYNGNGAIVHYHATDDACATLAAEGMFLLDSGGQYLNGTTDITRTISFGGITAKQRKDYTLVLKGHLAISQAKFPKGTRGSQLDALARQFLWADGTTYTHGTGHGVGHFLCVHEGPQNIRLEENPTTLELGMIVSNEPGIYRTDEYGIRIENLVTVVPDCTTEFGDFYKFDTLTLFPYDTQLIDVDLLSESEKEWINSYQSNVFAQLSPMLNAEECAWLKEKCRAL